MGLNGHMRASGKQKLQLEVEVTLFRRYYVYVSMCIF